MSVSGAGGSSPAPGPATFGDRLVAAVAARESQIVLGIDPDPSRLWPGPVGQSSEPRAELAQSLAAAHESAVAVAGAGGLNVLADGKRGDVPVTAAAYSQALTGATLTPFGPVPGLGADAVTANPLLGADALAPLVDGARKSRAGVFVLVRTSNPGAADLMDLPLQTGEPLWERLATLVAEIGRPGREQINDVGAVTGATAPQHLERMRELMPRTPFLLPGVGAQGGDVHALAPAFAPGRAAGLVTASRSIAHAHEARGGDPAAAARAEAE